MTGQNPNHWTTREFPVSLNFFFFLDFFLCGPCGFTGARLDPAPLQGRRKHSGLQRDAADPLNLPPPTNHLVPSVKMTDCPSITIAQGRPRAEPLEHPQRNQRNRLCLTSVPQGPGKHDAQQDERLDRKSLTRCYMNWQNGKERVLGTYLLCGFLLVIARHRDFYEEAADSFLHNSSPCLASYKSPPRDSSFWATPWRPHRLGRLAVFFL